MIPQKGDDWYLDPPFVSRHSDEFGFTMPLAVFIEDVRLRASGKSTAGGTGVTALAQEVANLKPRLAPSDVVESGIPVYFEGPGWMDLPVSSSGR